MAAVSVQQAPIRNESVVAAHVYSHSGEFAPEVLDLELPARGISFQFIRKYRSARARDMGRLGRGWTFTYAKWLEPDGADLLYHDGHGRIHRFASSAARHGFSAPEGFYAVLDVEAEGIVLRQRWGDRLRFESPEAGGRLRAIEDRNGNALRFEYREGLVLASDPLGRQIEIRLDGDRVAELRDHGRRSWLYRYDSHGCLVEVAQPALQGVADRPRVRYEYDRDLRLVAITDPKGQAFLRNHYDEQGRIRRQQHGRGTFGLEYDSQDDRSTPHPPHRTRLTAKNGARLDLRHDAAGHVVERTLQVTAAALSPEDRHRVDDDTVSLTTISTYNRHHELAERRYPAGNSTEWVYDEESTDPRAQGNLLRVKQLPAPAGTSDIASLLTRYTYEPRHQQVASLIDPRGHTVRFTYDSRGNLSTRTIERLTIQGITAAGRRGRASTTRLRESFRYNEAGQLVRVTHAGGAAVEYFYYRASDPSGIRSHHGAHPLTQGAGGYLARIVRDPEASGRRFEGPAANVTTGFVYDLFGNVTAALDGKGQATRFAYDSHNRLVRVTAREPFAHATSYGYDANGNAIEGTVAFDHHEYDPGRQEVVRKTTTLHQRLEYNALNNVVRQTLAAGGREARRTIIRDAAENIVREIQPMGNVVEYGFDERNLMIARRPGAGSDEGVEIRHTYTRNGSLRSTTDGRGGTQTYHYDGFHRYEGFRNAGGTVKRQWLDEIGNVTRIQITGVAQDFDERGEPGARRTVPLLESWFQYDELNRLVRLDRAWNDPSTGQALGHSGWDGKPGVVSSVVQYGHGLWPSRFWGEGGTVITVRHDGVNRVVALGDTTGETVSIEYDDNSNPVRLERLGPPPGESHERFRQILRQEFDALDRLAAFSFNDENPCRRAHNALGLLTEETDQAGGIVRHLHDALGRGAGRVTVAAAPPTVTGGPPPTLLHRLEWDGNDRLAAWINARGNATRYRYDALNRVVAVVGPDGTAYRMDRDANGNITRAVDPNGTIVTSRFDPLDRLIERRVESAQAGRAQVETLSWDGLDRLVVAATAGTRTSRHYDSLSRLLWEAQSGHMIRYRHDAAGHQVQVRYPGGREVQRRYDSSGRVTEVRGHEGVLATYTYAASTQLLEQRLGDALTVHFAYEPGRDRLKSIAYRSATTGDLIEGTAYRYDAVGNAVEEAQLRHGSDVGTRYFHDAARRLIRVQYGVEALSDPGRPLERDVLYELTPSGLWQRRETRGAGGQVIERVEGVTNLRDAHVSFAGRHFEYDANGNRTREMDLGGGGLRERRYAYDYANRLVRVERVDAAGQVVQAVAYDYDISNRQVSKRVTEGGTTTEYRRLWDGARLVEEMQNGELATSFVYGDGAGGPLKTAVHTADGVDEFFYMFNGSGDVTGLFSPWAGAVERYRYDAFGVPSLDGRTDGLQGRPVLSTRNHLFAGAQMWDASTAAYAAGGSNFDAHAGQFLNSSWGGSVAFYRPKTVTPPHPDWTKLEIIAGIGLIGLGFGIAAGTSLLGAALAGITIGIGAALIVDASFGSPVINAIGEWIEDLLGTGGNAPTGPGRPSGGVGTGGSNTATPGSSGGSSGTWGRPSGQPEERGFLEHKGSNSGGGGSGGSSGGDSGGRTGGPTAPSLPSSGELGGGMTPPPAPTPTPASKKQETPKQEQPKPEDKKPVPPGTPVATPNPVDGTGEGIDKDWWRGRPNADVLGIVAELRGGIRIDERHGTPQLRLIDSIDTYSLAAVLAPPPISMDERGETVSINLAGAQSRSTATGTTSDGWGDRPRTLAEALAAPRIRAANIGSRF